MEKPDCLGVLGPGRTFARDAMRCDGNDERKLRFRSTARSHVMDVMQLVFCMSKTRTGKREEHSFVKKDVCAGLFAVQGNEDGGVNKLVTGAARVGVCTDNDSTESSASQNQQRHHRHQEPDKLGNIMSSGISKNYLRYVPSKTCRWPSNP